MWIQSDGFTDEQAASIDARREARALGDARCDLIELAERVGRALPAELLLDDDITAIAEGLCDAIHDSSKYAPILRDGRAVDGYNLAAERMIRAAREPKLKGETA